MPQTTISVQNSGSYDKIQLEHDNRKIDEYGKPYFSKNVDSSLSSNNWYWEGNMTIREFYEREFEESFRLQTEKIRASHPERLEGRASSYYEQIMTEQLEGERLKEQLKLEGLSEKEINKKMSAISKVAYQTIIQFGDRDSEFGTLNGTKEGREIAKKVMREFIEKWQRDNPEMKFINIAIHADEIGADGKGGTVHMHITYCPVCTSYKKGMPVRNSLTGALKQMGYEADKKKDPETGEFRFAVEKWQQDMRDSLEHMLSLYGYTRLTPDDTRTGHETIADYGKRKDQLRKIEEGQAAVAEGQRENAEQKADLDKREKTVQNREKIVEDKKNEINARIHIENKRIAGANQELTEREMALDARETHIDEREQILENEAEASINQLKDTIIEAASKLRQAPGKRVNEYPPVAMKKGYRAVPEKDLEIMVERSWFSVSHVKDTVSKVVKKFNDLPFVKTARETIYQLEQQIISLRQRIFHLEKKNKEQQILLDKAKEIKLGTMGKTMYDHLTDEVAKDRQKVKDRYEHEDDRGR